MRKLFVAALVATLAATIGLSASYAGTGYLAWGDKLNQNVYYIVESLQMDTREYHLRLVVVSDDADKARHELIYQDSHIKRFKKGDRLKIGFMNVSGKGWEAYFWKSEKDHVCCFSIWSGTRLGGEAPGK